jgi:hypothetical protein
MARIIVLTISEPKINFCDIFWFPTKCTTILAISDSLKITFLSDFFNDFILTGMNKLGLVASLQVVEDRCIIEIGQVDHVITFLKLGRVDLTNLSRWESFFLKKTRLSLDFLI